MNNDYGKSMLRESEPLNLQQLAKDKKLKIRDDAVFVEASSILKFKQDNEIHMFRQDCDILN